MLRNVETRHFLFQRHAQSHKLVGKLEQREADREAEAHGGDDGHELHPELMRIAVLPEYRGRGYSRKLMERLEESARAAGAQELTLEVRESNEAALHLYKSCGFRVEAVRKDYYRNPKENALILWKRGFLGIPT